MHFNTYASLASLCGLLFLTSCEKEDSQPLTEEQPTAPTALEADFAAEDADMLELSPGLTIADADIIKGVELPEKEGLQTEKIFYGRTTIYTQTNEAAGNRLVVFRAAADGTLTESGRVATGGLGSGDGLGSQGSVHLSESGYFLYAVNAGNHTLSVFLVLPSGAPFLLSVAKLKGRRPVSVTSYRNVAYVVNAGTDDIEGFYLGFWGKLHNLPGSRRPLSSPGADPAQIAFKHNGRALLVTEKATQKLSAYAVGNDALPGEGHVTQAANPTPFGFDFGWGGRAVVTEAVDGAPGAAMVTAYRLSNAGFVSQLDESIALNTTAACWAVVHPSSNLAYVMNTGSNDISSLTKQGNSLAVANDGQTTPALSGPVDAGIDPRGGFLYVLLGGSDQVATYRMAGEGALQQIDEDCGLPIAVTGLAVHY